MHTVIQNGSPISSCWFDRYFSAPSNPLLYFSVTFLLNSKPRMASPVRSSYIPLSPTSMTYRTSPSRDFCIRITCAIQSWLDRRTTRIPSSPMETDTSCSRTCSSRTCNPRSAHPTLRSLEATQTRSSKVMFRQLVDHQPCSAGWVLARALSARQTAQREHPAQVDILSRSHKPGFTIGPPQ